MGWRSERRSQRKSRGGFENHSEKIHEGAKAYRTGVLTKSDPIVLESLLEHAIDSEALDEFGEMLYTEAGLKFLITNVLARQGRLREGGAEK